MTSHFRTMRIFSFLFFFTLIVRATYVFGDVERIPIIDLRINDIPDIAKEKPMPVSELSLDVQRKFQLKGEAILKSLQAQAKGKEIVEVLYQNIPLSSELEQQFLSMLEEADYKEAFVYKAGPVEYHVKNRRYNILSALQYFFDNDVFADETEWAYPPKDKKRKELWIKTYVEMGNGVTSQGHSAIYLDPYSFSIGTIEDVKNDRTMAWAFEFIYDSPICQKIFEQLENSLPTDGESK